MLAGVQGAVEHQRGWDFRGPGRGKKLARREGAAGNCVVFGFTIFIVLGWLCLVGLELP